MSWGRRGQDGEEEKMYCLSSAGLPEQSVKKSWFCGNKGHLEDMWENKLSLTNCHKCQWGKYFFFYLKKLMYIKKKYKNKSFWVELT